MAFTIDDSLAPELYPLAWLVGDWRGTGVLDYPGIAHREAVQEVSFTHDGGPYLRYESTLSVFDDPSQDGEAAAVPPPDTRTTTVWSTETGYWRIAPERPNDMKDGVFPVEVFLADPSGNVSLNVGEVGNGRIDIVSDAIARAATGAAISASRRTYGLVEGSLLWVWELAAFGNPLSSYFSASLDRVP